MNAPINPKANQALEKALSALRSHDNAEVQRWALQAARLAPEWDAPLIVLASVSDPETSIRHLKRALELNPESERARQGMHWAVKRLRRQETASKIPVDVEATQKISIKARASAAAPLRTAEKPAAGQKAPESAAKKPLRIWAPVLLALMLLCSGAAAVYAFAPGDLGGLTQKPQGMARSQALDKPTQTSTSLPTPTRTPEPTATRTPEPTATSLPTEEPTPGPTQTKPEPLPTFTPEAIEIYYPGDVDAPTGDRWIDINLTYQQLYAYVGDEMVNAFIVSTGTWEHPTVTGRYSIYVKYRYDDMQGPGYYLPDVPYTMYFYKGYGIHGTYWHSNFGTPMSHGCVNLRTSDAEWLYNWASVGTIVNVHY